MPVTSPPHVMTISGSDSAGAAGIQADLKTFAVLNTYGTSVLTAVTAQNTREVAAIAEVPEEIVIAQIDTVAEDIGAEAVKTGMLTNERIITNLVDRLEAWGFPFLVVNPLMVSATGVPLLSQAGVEPLKHELLPMATIVTPDRVEAEALTGRSVNTRQDMEAAAGAIHALGPRFVAITGDHPGGASASLVFDGDAMHWLDEPDAGLTSAYGAGSTFSAAITALLAHGCPPGEAIRLARRFVANALDHAYAIGEGALPLNHGAPLPAEIAACLRQPA